MVTPVLLMKSKVTRVWETLVFVKLKLKLNVVSGVDAPPPPSFISGSVPSARAAEQEIPKKATRTNKREISTTLPPIEYNGTQHKEKKAQFNHLLTPQCDSV